MSIALQSNPFATRFIRPGEIPYFDSVQTVESIVREFQRHNYVGQIVGPHGSGKTSLTIAMTSLLKPRFDAINQVTIRDCRTIHATPIRVPLDGEPATDLSDQPTDRELLIIDGYERLPRLHRWLLRRQLGQRGLLVTSHARVSGLPVIHEMESELATFLRVVDHLAPKHPFDPKLLRQTFERHKGNIRESLMTLYDMFEADVARSQSSIASSPHHA